MYKNKLNKYENKIKLLGGSNPSSFRPVCDNIGFHQHEGECWHDAIQMIFCFSDSTKDVVQEKLYRLTSRQILDLAQTKGIEYIIPNFFIDTEEAKEDFETKIIDYLDNFIARFKNHFELSSKKEKTEGRPDSFYLGPACELTARRISRPLSNEEESGGDFRDDIIIITLLSYLLLENNEFITFEYKFTDEIFSVDDIDDIDAIILSSINHATCFYTCDKIEKYYDDNYGVINFNWKNFLKLFISKGSENPKLILAEISNKLKIPCILIKKDLLFLINDKLISIPQKDVLSIYIVTYMSFCRKITINNNAEFLEINREILIDIAKNTNKLTYFNYLIDNELDIEQIYDVSLSTTEEIVKYVISKYVGHEFKLGDIYLIKNKEVFDYYYANLILHNEPNDEFHLNILKSVIGNDIIFNTIFDKITSFEDDKYILIKCANKSYLHGIKKLLDKIDINYISEDNNSVLSITLYKCRKYSNIIDELIDQAIYLIDNGADVTMKYGSMNLTILSLVIHIGNKKLFEKIIKKGANVNDITIYDIKYLLVYDYYGLLEYIVYNYPEVLDKMDKSLIMYTAISNGNTSVAFLEKIINQGSTFNGNNFMLANNIFNLDNNKKISNFLQILNRPIDYNAEKIDDLIDKNDLVINASMLNTILVNIDTIDKKKIILRLIQPYKLTYMYHIRNEIELYDSTLIALLDRIPDINITDENNNNLLQIAIRNNLIKIIEYLFTKDINVNHLNRYNENILHIMIKSHLYEDIYNKIVDMILSKKLYNLLDNKDINGLTPITLLKSKVPRDRLLEQKLEAFEDEKLM